MTLTAVVCGRGSDRKLTTMQHLPSSFASGWVRYQLSVCVLGGATTACRTVACPDAARCTVDNLLAGTTYSVTSVAFKADNTRSSISNTVSRMRLNVSTDFVPVPGDRMLC